MSGQANVAVRMYNAGFGDAFLVTVTRNGGTWRMLVDCGVHSQGRARPIEEVVHAIIGDLKTAAADGIPRLDVVVATHHHADHIAGFAYPGWEEVVVGEVWLPFAEDAEDPDAKALKQGKSAQRLLALIDQREDPSPELVTARWFALNSLANADATDRLIGRNGKRFANQPPVRYLPALSAEKNEIAAGIDGVVVHVLGPSRDPKQLARMDPPAGAGWLTFDLDDTADDGAESSTIPLFNSAYVVNNPTSLPGELVKAQKSMNLHAIKDADILAAASILEDAVNNTSLFMVLDVAGTRLLFPGDAQQGAWEHVLGDPGKRQLVADAVFYKISHHGSANATPKDFIEKVWRDGAPYAMLPWGLVKRWEKTIPKQTLIDALGAHQHTVIPANAPVAEPGKVTVYEDLWSEVTFDTA